MATVKVLAGFPSPPGNKLVAIGEVTGPSSYSTISTGSPPTGGQTVYATDFGMVALDFAEGGASDDGQYGVRPIFPSNPNGPVSSILLMWYTLATGAQVASGDLSGRTARLKVEGY
jgi:hypothetical protein